MPALLEMGIGLWDVVAEASCSGSLDSNIVDYNHNDLPALTGSLQQLHTIAFNGGTAAKIGLKALATRADRYRIQLLPSSNPAFTLACAQKLLAWQQLKIT